MQKEAFKLWLEEGGAKTPEGREARAHAVQTIEANLEALGSSHATLEAAWAADRFGLLRQRLANLLEDFLAGGTNFHILMPALDKRCNRLRSWRSWLGQYGRFLSGEPRGDLAADRVRQYVLETYIEPAREKEAETADVPVRAVHDALGLHQSWPNVCQALDGRKLLDMIDLAPPEKIGPDQSPATIFRFHLSDAPNDGPSFILFNTAGEAFKPVRSHNRRTSRSAYRVKPPGASNEADEALEVDTLADLARAMLVDGRPARIQSASGGPINYLTYGKRMLVRYELDPITAQQIGISPHGEIGAAHAPINPLPFEHEEGLHMPVPTNLILYGPPGTGKTYATAMEAVRLCGESVPSERKALMASYHRLAMAGRIEFITFHQSTAYEDFVEALRPKQSSDTGTAGFELRAEQGVFRRIARRAETSTGPGKTSFSVKGRQVFKMSIGEAANPDDAYLFEEAIEGSYTLLGFEDIDWSDERFANRAEIIAAVRRDGVMSSSEPNGMSGRVQMPFIFRNSLKRDDIVVVSKGNGLFRAIGEVIGDYQFAPREGGDYGHRRAVKWLWVDRVGVPVSEIYARNFSQKTIYVLTPADLNLPALERYIASQQNTGRGDPESFVLIIDEINRANISKVFGELITLLEPDKRLKQLNALQVRLPYSGDMFGVPANLHIVGTMNTADRSIALLDTALRRRFEFRELVPDPSQLIAVDGIELPKLLATLNERIEYLFDREHQIGHAYFMECRNRTDVDAVMRYKIIPLLAEYFYEDWDKVAAVLGDGSDAEGDREGRFLVRRRLKAPTSINGDEDSTPRYRWKVRETFSYEGFVAE